MSDVCLHPELDALSGPLLPLASQARQVARRLDAAPDPDGHVVLVDGWWYVRHPGRRRGSAGISADHWESREAALAAYAELTAHLAAQAAALAGGVR